MKKGLFILFALILLGVLFALFSKQPPELASKSQSHQALSAGEYRVVHNTITLTDSTRGIDANGDYQGDAQRQFKLDLWRPAKVQSGPLVVYSHGFMSNGKGGKYLGEHLASLGYTVAAPTFPLTHYGAPGGPNPADVVNQIDDVRFVIDTFLARNADPQDELHSTIDPERIAAVGLSLGGMTTKLVAYHPKRADTRIAAAVSIAGPSYLFTKRFFAQRAIPFLMVASPIDAMIAYESNAANILAKISNAVLLSVDGASHSGFSDTARWLRWFSNPDSLGCDALMGNLDATSNQSWYHKLGLPEDGVIGGEPPPMCTVDPLPEAINPLRQHQITALAVSRFLQCQFALDLELAARSCQFLTETLAEEFAEVSVESNLPEAE